MSAEQSTQRKFEELSVHEQAEYIIRERTPSPDQVIYTPTVEFLDPQGELSREERARVVAIGDRTAISYKELGKKVLDDRILQSQNTEATDKTASFFQMYALAARSSKEIAHTSILEQLGPGPETFGGDSPIIMEGISILAGLRDICSQRYGAFEAFSSRGGIFPDKYWRVPTEIAETGVGKELEAISEDLYKVYLDLTQKGLEAYLKVTPKKEGEKSWQYRWRVLNLALDDSRQVTNGSFLNHLSYHPNSALALRETIAELSTGELSETRELAGKLRELAKAGLPNIMQYTEGSEYTGGLYRKRKEIIRKYQVPQRDYSRGVEGESRFITGTVTPDAEKVFLSAFLAKGKDVPFSAAVTFVNTLDDQQIGEILSEIFDGIGLHDKPPKELESVKTTAEMLMSLGGIYELIRHRGTMHVASDIGINNGFTVPAIYKRIGLEEEYKYGISLNERAYDLVDGMGSDYSALKAYYVARGHIQPVTIFMDGFNAFHFLKIRASDAAHPDIQKPSYEYENFLRTTSSPLFKYLVKK